MRSNPERSFPIPQHAVDGIIRQYDIPGHLTPPGQEFSCCPIERNQSTPRHPKPQKIIVSLNNRVDVPHAVGIVSIVLVVANEFPFLIPLIESIGMTDPKCS